MADRQDEPITYVIPPNFIERGTVLGGMLKLRNTIEAGAAELVISLPTIRLDISPTLKIILLCLTALPAAILALVGVSGECLSSFIRNFFRYLKNRRVLGGSVSSKKGKDKTA